MNWRLLLIAAAILRHERRRAIERLFIADAILRRRLLVSGPSHFEATFTSHIGLPRSVARALDLAACAMRHVFDVGSPGEIAKDAKVRCTRLGRAGDEYARAIWQQIENDARREAREAGKLLAELAETREQRAEDLARRLDDFRRGGAQGPVLLAADALVTFVRDCPHAAAKRKLVQHSFLNDVSGAGEVSARQWRRRIKQMRAEVYLEHPDVGRQARTLDLDQDVKKYKKTHESLVDCCTAEAA